MKNTKGKPAGTSLRLEYGDEVVLGGADDLGTDGRDADEQRETTSRNEEAWAEVDGVGEFIEPRSGGVVGDGTRDETAQEDPFTKSPVIRAKMLISDAPRTFRTLISRVRRSVTKVTSPRRPRHATKIATPKNPTSTRPSWTSFRY